MNKILFINACVRPNSRTLNLAKAFLEKQEGEIEIINLKPEPLLLYELLQDNAIFRAYHMNKEKWISVDVLNVEKDKLKWLIDISFNLTK